MDMLEHIFPGLPLFFMLYGAAAVTAVILCLYMLFRRGNAIAADITPPMRLRRWTAALFAVTALSHVWWYIFYVYSWDTRSVSYVVLCILDSVTLLTAIPGTLLSMLQDRERPLWPFVAAMIPIVILGGLQIAFRDIDFITPSLVYILAFYALFTIYMVIAVRQYGQWLRDNYADLEHKEVLQSHTLLIVLLLVIVTDGFIIESTFLVYLERVLNFVLFGLLLWRVETLPQLEVVNKRQENSLPADSQSSTEVSTEDTGLAQKTQAVFSNIEQLLAKHCVEARLYLQHDLTLTQLAAAVGTNRSYLSQYFSNQGTTYNAYINNLRIDHFVTLYRDAVDSQRPFTFQQLAGESGYRSYSTFSLAFKQRMGQSVTVWMRDTAQ